jgi:hypothetical protein
VAGIASPYGSVDSTDFASYWRDNLAWLYGGATGRVTTSTFAGGPPGSPVDGDIWIATAVDGNGTRWMFQYNAGSASAYKWEFIGGAPVLSAVDGTETTTSTSFTDLATVGPSFTAVRAGDYLVNGSAYFYNNAAFVTLTALKVGAATAMSLSLPLFASTAATQEFLAGARAPRVTAAANDVIKMQYRVTGGTGTFASRHLDIVPVRIA